MGTRCIIAFKDTRDTFYVYQHWDGDPDTVKENVEKAKTFAWPLPRFEADEFAAAYIKANKDGSGDIRVGRAPENYGDLDFSYTVTLNKETDDLDIKTRRE
jgi:hypothetical protein